MKWISQFDLFLFDFDGLLVNTEDLHFAAYKEMVRRRGFSLEWDFEAFCKAAHFDSAGLQKAIYETFPALKEQEASWSVLYAEKKQAYQDLLMKGEISLMPGVEKLLSQLNQAGIKRCVVTNSTKEQTDLIRSHLPILNTISHWVTRETYTKAKPDPECYQKAKALLFSEGERAVGFEDSYRGIKALEGAEVEKVLICKKEHPQMQDISSEKMATAHFESFEDIPSEFRF